MAIEKFLNTLDQILLQIMFVRPDDGGPKLDVVTATVRVFHVDENGETIFLPETALIRVGSSSTWRYVWLNPPITESGTYVAEYYALDDDADEAYFTEDITIVDDTEEDQTVLARLAALEAVVTGHTGSIETMLDVELGRQWLDPATNTWKCYRRNGDLLIEFDTTNDIDQPDVEDVFQRRPK